MRARALFAVGFTSAALAGLVACAPEPPTATTTTTTTSTLPTTGTRTDFACNDNAFVLEFRATAPATVPQNLPYQVTLSVAPVEIPSSSGTNTLTYFENLRLRIAVPSGAVLAGLPILSGGSNLGTAVPSASVLPSGAVELLIPGPLTPGTIVTFPTVTLPFLAVGAPGTALDLRLAGSFTTTPSLTFTIGVQLTPTFVLPVTQNCVEFNPNGPSVLSSTTVTSLIPPN